MSEQDPWVENPDFPRSDWREEVQSDSTLRGYWEWVESKIEEASDDQNNG